MKKDKPKRKPIVRWILTNKDGTGLSWEHHHSKKDAIAEGRKREWKGMKPVKLVEAK